MINKAIYLSILLLFTTVFSFAQIVEETPPPYHIKTVAFMKENRSLIPFFKLGESFTLQFDDLYGTEADYYYTIKQYNYDWKPTNIAKMEYMQGIDNQRIMTYFNSFNTLQLYSHYTQNFPNKFNTITKSGNYLISIFDENQELVFSKKVIIYEDLVSVGAIVRKSRDLETIQSKQNLDFTINLGENVLQNPKQNIKVSIYQNGRMDTALHNIAPQYTIGNELVYRYNKETQFWGGNEFLNFDNNTIRATNNTVMKYTSGDGIYNTHLYPNYTRKYSSYTFFPDVNGDFVVKNNFTENPEIEADYSWVYFTLVTERLPIDQSIYIVGWFNNFAKNEENKMEFNEEKNVYEKAIFIKQGFVNFEYDIMNENGVLDRENAIDGNFFPTENTYTILVYYRGNNDRYDRVIAKGYTDSTIMQN